MSTETEEISIDIDLDVGGLETARPVLPAREYGLLIKSVEAIKNKAETGYNLLVIFSTTERYKSTTGDEVPSGFTVRKYYPLQANVDKLGTPEYDEKAFLKDLAVLFDAVNETDARSRPAKLTVQILKGLAGKYALVPLTVEKDPQFGLVNSVTARGIKTQPV